MPAAGAVAGHELVVLARVEETGLDQEGVTFNADIPHDGRAPGRGAGADRDEDDEEGLSHETTLRRGAGGTHERRVRCA